MCILPEEGRSQEKLQSLVNNDKAKQNKKLGDMWAKDGILAQPLIDPSNTSWFVAVLVTDILTFLYFYKT